MPRAGKCGSLLITLLGDATERLDYRKAKTHATAVCSEVDTVP